MAVLDVWRPIFRRFLEDPDGEERVVIVEAVSGATSVRDAVERANLFDTLSEAHAAEGRAVLEALPPEVDTQILEALKDGINRGVPMSFDWREHADISAEISEIAESRGVHILVRSPDGAEFV
jgi:hypothetical protein